MMMARKEVETDREMILERIARENNHAGREAAKKKPQGHISGRAVKKNLWQIRSNGSCWEKGEVRRAMH